MKARDKADRDYDPTNPQEERVEAEYRGEGAKAESSRSCCVLLRVSPC